MVALFFAATGRQGRLLLQLTGASIVLGVLSILIGSEPVLADPAPVPADASRSAIRMAQRGAGS